MTTELGKRAGRVDMYIERGADYSETLRYATQAEGEASVPVNLTGWSASAVLRKIAGGDAWLTLSSAAVTGARLSLSSDGTIAVVIPAATTAADTWDSRVKGVWTLVLTSPAGAVIRLCEGLVEVDHG